MSAARKPVGSMRAVLSLTCAASLGHTVEAGWAAERGATNFPVVFRTDCEFDPAPGTPSVGAMETGFGDAIPWHYAGSATVVRRSGSLTLLELGEPDAKARPKGRDARGGRARRHPSLCVDVPSGLLVAVSPGDSVYLQYEAAAFTEDDGQMNRGPASRHSVFARAFFVSTPRDMPRLFYAARALKLRSGHSGFRLVSPSLPPIFVVGPPAPSLIPFTETCERFLAGVSAVCDARLSSMDEAAPRLRECWSESPRRIEGESGDHLVFWPGDHSVVRVGSLSVETWLRYNGLRGLSASEGCDFGLGASELLAYEVSIAYSPALPSAPPTRRPIEGL